MKINRVKFWDSVRSAFGSFTQSQVNALNFILDKLDGSEIINRLSWYAYVLATIYWETAQTFLPIIEKGSQAYLRGKKYFPYIGRGYVQLTWKYNYQKFGELLAIDLVNNPELACDPETAWKILEIGMSKGLFTGKGLSDYLNANVTDFLHARRIINGNDRASEIKTIALKFYEALEFEEAA